MSDAMKSKRWEADLLGCLMLDSDTLADMEATGLTAGDFSNDRRGRLFSWLAARIEARKPTDMISVVESIALRADRADFPGLAEVSGYSDDCCAHRWRARRAELQAQRTPAAHRAG
mgnify:CR=1 FL=1